MIWHRFCGIIGHISGGQDDGNERNSVINRISSLDCNRPFSGPSSRMWKKVYPFAKSLLKQRFHTEQHTGGFQSTGDPLGLAFS
jgi:hypothetical protein